MPDNPSLQRRQLGMELKRLREEAHRTRDEAATILNRDLSTISRMENGLSAVRVAELEKLLDLYAVTGESRENVLAIGAEARRRRGCRTYTDAAPNWFRRYIALEAEAVEVRGFEVELIPGLLQSEDYLRAILTCASPRLSPEEIERNIRIRLARRELLTRSDPIAPHFWFVLNEAVLHRRIGGPTIMSAQLTHLAEVALLPNVTIQVLPFSSGEHPAVGVSFCILRFGDQPGQDVVYLDSLSSALYPEREADIQWHGVVFRRLQSDSLSPPRSREMIASTAKEYM